MTLDEIRKLIEAATPGPWVCNSRDITVFKIPCEKGRGDGWHTVEVDTCDGRSGYNVEFIAAARALLPALLQVADKAEWWTEHKESCVRYHRMPMAGCDCGAQVVFDALAALEALRPA